MTWTRLSDDAIDVMWDLSDGAFRLHVSATILSNRLLSDGFVRRDRLRTIVQRLRQSDVQDLIAAGVWREAPGGYELIDFHLYQQTRAAVLERREMEREKKHRQRARPKVTSSKDEHHQTSPWDDPGDALGDSPGPRPIPPLPDLGFSRNTPPIAPSDGWKGWGAEWEPFAQAWRERFNLAPTGPQRQVLWPIIDARPTDVAGWLRAAPAEARASDIVGYLLRHWKAIKSGGVG